MTVEFGDGIGPLETAAVLAALARFWEELSILEAIPPAPLTQGRWVASGRPRPVDPPPADRAVPRAMRESPSRSESGGV
ncbi:MAG: hypothetical protein A2Z12_03240 [Actinobacteria bacterium RBG_16_68_21]|nr:MAG: hypothetical protein A2Z12_03240 [Actinobacteria bacterium RBG_16_68_21]